MDQRKPEVEFGKKKNTSVKFKDRIQIGFFKKYDSNGDYLVLLGFQEKSEWNKKKDNRYQSRSAQTKNPIKNAIEVKYRKKREAGGNKSKLKKTTKRDGE